MKDAELRGHILDYYYKRRREAWSLPKPEDLGLNVSDIDILYVADQLGEKNLLEWRRQGSHGKINVGMGKINSFGIDVVEGNIQPPLKIEFMQNKTINITGSTNVVVGDNNTTKQSVQELVRAIDMADGTPAQKEEAKSLLRNFLKHPLLSAIAGGAVGLLS